ncbi:MAG: PTS sugar transporter subunit IIC [Erysipelotrichaceae bacterium]|nr:PTS sugar transporter subunit IIC [Erysipelotrichaceae bacterium]
MVLQAILVALIATISTWWFSHTITRTWLYPIWSGFLVALVMGQPLRGMQIAAAINLPYIGFITAGGSMPGNAMFAGPVGTALALVAGLDYTQASVVGVILGSVAVFAWNAYMTINANWVHLADKFLEQGNLKMVRLCNYVPSFFVSLLLNGLPAFLIVMNGESFGNWLQSFPQWIMDGFAIAGGLLPALGVGMLLNFLGKKKLIPFFFLGFALAKFVGLSTMMVTVVGALIALLIYYSQNEKVGE